MSIPQVAGEKSYRRLTSHLCARLQEPSTYAGLSAVFVALATALSLTGTARYLALFAAFATGVGAIARAENNASLCQAMEEAAQLVPAAEEAIRTAEAASQTNLQQLRRVEAL